MDTSKLTPGVIVILAAGLVTLIFSFFAFYTFDPGGGRIESNADELLDECRDQAEDQGLDPDDFCGPAEEAADLGSEKDYSAWSSDIAGGVGLFPVATLPAIYGLIMAVQIGLSKLAGVKFPERILGMTWGQIHLALGFNAALIMLAFLVRERGTNVDFGFGFYLMLLGSIALVVGAVLALREDARGPATPPSPPPSAPPTA